MPDLPTLGLFLAATAALLLVPGPSVLFMVARTLEHGRRGGLVSMLGVETGALLHVLAATAGLSALIAASPGALLVIKLGGAAYLLWMGVRALRRPPELTLSGGPCLEAISSETPYTRNRSAEHHATENCKTAMCPLC